MNPRRASSRTSSAWLPTPVLANIERSCVRIVSVPTPNRFASSGTDPASGQAELACERVGCTDRILMRLGDQCNAIGQGKGMSLFPMNERQAPGLSQQILFYEMGPVVMEACQDSRQAFIDPGSRAAQAVVVQQQQDPAR